MEFLRSIFFGLVGASEPSYSMCDEYKKEWFMCLNEHLIIETKPQTCLLVGYSYIDDYNNQCIYVHPDKSFTIINRSENKIGCPTKIKCTSTKMEVAQ